MNKLEKILLFVLIGVLVLVGSSISYFYYKYDKAKKQTKSVEKATDEYDRALEERKEITLNGKKHTLKFKYFYVENVDAVMRGDEDCEYFKFKVLLNMYFDDINITNISKHNKNQNLFFESGNKNELTDTQNTVRKMSLIDDFTIEVIKGKDKKDYLFVSINARLESVPMSPSYELPMIINEDGEIIYELTDITNFEKYYYPDNEEFEAKYTNEKNLFKGFYITNEKGYSEINYLAVKIIAESGDKKEIGYGAYITNLYIENNKVAIEEERLSSHAVRWTNYW